jgi:hypothetical protein
MITIEDGMDVARLRRIRLGVHGPAQVLGHLQKKNFTPASMPFW